MDEKKVLLCKKKEGIDVDIMMLTYNHENFIEQAIDSILMQKTDYSYRILIGEDCSTDNTRKIVEDYYRKYPDKMEVVLWEKNVGGLKNDLEIMHRCNARYVASLEGDDYWTDCHKLQKQISFLESHPEYIGTAHNIRCVDEKGSLLHRDFDYYYIREAYIYGKELAKRQKMVSQTASLVYRNIYRSWSQVEWDFYEHCGINGDLVGQVLLGIQSEVYFFSDIMADHRRIFKGDSWTAKSVNKNRIYKEYTDLKKIQKFLEKNYCVTIKTDDLWKHYFMQSKIRFLSHHSLENFRVCLRMICSKGK
ncbi:MAG: glycosyltransferase [Lachnospiraceae bacterium]